MDLQQTWEKFESLRELEMVEFSSTLTEKQMKYISLKSDLRIAEWHLEWMQKPSSVYSRYSTAHQRRFLEMQNEKIKNYRIQIEKLESEQHLAQC